MIHRLTQVLWLAVWGGMTYLLVVDIEGFESPALAVTLYLFASVLTISILTAEEE